MIEDNNIIANVSINPVSFIHQNTNKKYIQISTVMTDSAYKNKGLSKYLLNKVLDEYKDKCDAIFLFANNSVLDFYPKFGFKKLSQHQYKTHLKSVAVDSIKLNMDNVSNRNFLLEKYKYTNPYSVFSMINNESILMYHCLNYMKDNIYYIEDLDAVVILEKTQTGFMCHDVYCKEILPLESLISMCIPNDSEVSLGFTPNNKKDYWVCNELNDENASLFIYKASENIIAANKLMFPLLSRA